MKVGSIDRINIKPTNKKMENAKKIIKEQTKSILPKEMPIEKKAYWYSEADIFDMVKNKIQITIDNMRK